MDTAERTENPTAGTVYDGFISYSHAADGLLAPRLQSALQRFAKPWWKRRATRIFRDESSLSANPHLWSSITEALDRSAWFVLLLSPDAAGSEWVSQEIEYWKEHQDPSRILPVVTDGEFGWEGTDVTGNSVPDALRGVFTEEPRWVDLRFARNEVQLDLKNPRFSAAVADIASSLRGVPKDELESEEVKQHRRTVRTAWGAVVLVLLLGTAAVFAAVQASQNAREAERLAEIAAASAEAEAEARREAEANAEEATRQAAISKSRELSASAVAALDEDPELATMLALESVAASPQDTTPSPEAVRTLRSAVLANRLEKRFDGTGGYARISPDGSTLYHSQDDPRALVAVDIESGRELWSSDSIPAGNLGRVEVSPDGSMVSLQVHHPEGQKVFIFDASTGPELARFDPGEGCSGLDIEGLSAIGGFSPGGQWFSIFTGRPGCGAEPGEGWVAVYDTATWEEAGRLNTEDGFGFAAEFSREGDRVLLSTGDVSAQFIAELRSFPDLDLIRVYENVHTPMALSPDGQRIAYLDSLRGPILAETETGEIISSLSHAAEAFFFVEPMVFSPDGSKLLVAARGRDFVFDGGDGQFLGALGGNGPTVSGSFTADGTHLLTTRFGTSLIWNFTTGQAIGDETFSGDWINPEQATDGPLVAVNVFDFEGPPMVLAVLDPESGEVIGAKNGWGAQLADGRFVLVPFESSPDVEEVGPLQVWDPGNDTTTVLGGCAVSFDSETILDASGAVCPGGEPFFGGSHLGDPFVAISDPGGSAFAAQSLDSSSVVVIWDQDTLSRISEFEIPPTQTLVGMSETWIVTRQSNPQESEGSVFVDRLSIYDFQGTLVTEIDAESGGPYIGSVLFDVERSLLLARDTSGVVTVYETQSWQPIVSWNAHEGFIRGWSLSDDGQRLATSGEDGFVRIWDLSPIELEESPSAPELAIPLPVPRISDVVWVSDDRLVVFLVDRGTGARWFTAYLETDDLVSAARASLTRGFTEIECNTYQIDDCPMTLEEIRRG